MAKVRQSLGIYLKSAENIEVRFNAEKLNELNPQINQFIQAVAKKDKEKEFFAFQGKRFVLVRLDDVVAVDVQSFEIEEAEESKTKVESAA